MAAWNVRSTLTTCSICRIEMLLQHAGIMKNCHRSVRFVQVEMITQVVGWNDSQLGDLSEPLSKDRSDSSLSRAVVGMLVSLWKDKLEEVREGLLVLPYHRLRARLQKAVRLVLGGGRNHGHDPDCKVEGPLLITRWGYMSPASFS